MSNLNPHQFVHFSDRELRPGDELTPPAERGEAPNWSMSSPHHVYVAHPEALDDYGFHMNYGKHAYAVTPHGPVERDPEGVATGGQHTDPEGDNYDPYGPLSYRAPRARVDAVIRSEGMDDRTFR